VSADPEPSASHYDPPSTRFTLAAVNAGSAAAHRDRAAAIHLPLRCTRCGDVIGVYEPLVILTDGDGKVHETSLAAQPDLSPHGEYYHRACSGQR
jgi:hypothetical protein